MNQLDEKSVRVKTWRLKWVLRWLGAVCGFGRPLTLAEVFKPAEDTERIVLTLTLREGASDKEIQQEIEGFADALVGLNWADENPLIGRLTDALFGAVGVVEYEDAASA